jgi:uncharacterized protein YegP (UPF0339 family)
MAGRYEVSDKSDKSDDSRFRITATVGDAIASSVGYATGAGAPGGIGSVNWNADLQVVGLTAQAWNGEVMMGEITTAGGKYSLSFSEGIIESIWRPGSVVDVEDARASISAVERLSGGTPAPLLVQMTDVQVSAAARHAYDEARSVAAVALVGSSVVDRVVAAALGRLTFCPHEYFTSRPDAVAWLKRITAGPDPQSAGGSDNLPTWQ